MAKIKTLSCILIFALSLIFFKELKAENKTKHVLDSLKKGEWYEVPKSRMDVVAYKWPKGIIYTANGTGVRAVMANWSGGAFDTKRCRLLIWGGGHMAYAGNEIYAFDVNKLSWKRLCDPSLKTDRAGKFEKAGQYEDGTPRSGHSYNSIQYVAAIDSLCLFGVAGQFPSGQSNSKYLWTFNFLKNKWEKKGEALARGIGAYSAKDPVSGHVFVRGTGRPYFYSWDPVKEKLTKHSGQLFHRTDYRKSAVIDPLGRRFHGIGGKKIYSFDLNKGDKIKQDILSSTGPQNIVNKGNPGLQYDPVLDKIVGWEKGTDLFLLDPETFVWEKKAAASSNKVQPTPPCSTGTYGRFRYVPRYNVYILVNSTKTNVFFYRLSDRKTAPIPPRFIKILNFSSDETLLRYVAKETAKWPAKTAKPILENAFKAQKKNKTLLKIIKETLATLKK